MPYPRPLEALGEEIHYDTGDYIGLLDKLFAKIGWDKLNADVKKRKAAGELVGIGVAMFVEKSGLGPTDGVKISIDTSGTVEVVTGGASIGQGFETVMAQVAADALGVDYRRCRVIHGQTDRIPFGIGAHASRATVMTASATHIAALNVAPEGARSRRRTAADDARRARHRRWRSGAPRPRHRPLDQPRQDRAKSRARHQDARRPRAGALRRRLVQDRASGLSVWQPRRRGAGRPRHRRRCRRALLPSPTTSAAPSIRRWSRARSSAASRKGSAARCSRNSPTASAAIRWP